jgi:hypothetical protein
MLETNFNNQNTNNNQVDQFQYIEDQDLTAAVIDYSEYVEKFGSPEKQ